MQVADQNHNRSSLFLSFVALIVSLQSGNLKEQDKANKWKLRRALIRLSKKLDLAPERPIVVFHIVFSYL